MEKTNDDHKHLEDLRKSAEKQLKDRSADQSDISPEQDQRLLHELQVHQIELEMQNDELRRSQVELEISRAKYFDLFDLAPIGYLTLNEKGLILEANLTASRLLGVERSLLVNHPLTRFVSRDTQDSYYLHHKQLIGMSTPQMFELRMMRRDGTPFWVLMETIAVQADESGSLVYKVVMSDITTRKQAEEELRSHRDHLEELVKERTIELAARNTQLEDEIKYHKKAEEEKKILEFQLSQAQKMEALGRFAAGIAHDLNNIMYPIIIDTELLLNETAPEASSYLMLKQVLSAAYRQRDLVKQILLFSQRREQQLYPIKIKPLLNETLNLLRSSLPSTLEIHKHIDAQSDKIMGDPTQIQQILMNLFRNAVDAIKSQEGTIEVGLKNTYLESNLVHQEMKAGEYLQLTVRDTGTGMTSEVMDRIFEPFFTTKEIGKGSGMGLAIVHTILKSHGGGITVESELGKGSQFTIYLPITDKKYRTQKSYQNKTRLTERKKKLLLVDDEDIILSSVKNALTRLGYDVATAKDGLEALGLFRNAPDEFDLVLTDHTMPRMTGVELVPRLMDIRPDIPVILCTGFGDVIDEQEAKAKGIRGLLLKPASIRELDSIIRRALEE